MSDPGTAQAVHRPHAASVSYGALALLVLAGLNLRPFLTAFGPVLDVVRADTGLGRAAALLTTLPFVLMGVVAGVGVGRAARGRAARAERRAGADRGRLHGAPVERRQRGPDRHRDRRGRRRRRDPGARARPRETLVRRPAAARDGPLLGRAGRRRRVRRGRAGSPRRAAGISRSPCGPCPRSSRSRCGGRRRRATPCTRRP